MNKISILLNLLLILNCLNIPAQEVRNGLDEAQAQLSEKQAQLIFEKSKLFPEHTQLSIAVIESGKVNFVGIKRENDSIFQIENHKSTFEIGSISKVFTSALLANFVENNQLELATSIQDLVDFELNTDQSISLKELANHTSGLPRLPSNLNLLLVNPNNPYATYDEEKLITYLKEEIQLSSTPGEKYAYSNLGAGLLGYFMTIHSNSDFETLLNELIFSKYEMSSSTSDLTKIKSELVKGLDSTGKETSNWDFNVLAGAGGILSTVEDLSKFALASFDGNQKALQLTHEPTFTVSDNMNIALGWHILQANGGKNNVIWHNGGTGGYSTSMVLDLTNENGVIILSNVSTFHKNMGEIDALCFGLMKLISEW